MMAHCEGMLQEKNLLIFLFRTLVWFCPLSCWCLDLTVLDLNEMHASQVSDNGDYSADLAIDGNSDTNIQHCSHTSHFDAHPWWKVDLGANHCLGRITLVNRGDCCPERMNGTIVRAGIESDIFNNAACGLPVTSDQASIPGAHIPIVCDPPVIARYVSVEDDIPTADSNALTLCEVIVEEYPMEDCALIATTDMSTAAMIVNPSVSITCLSTLMFVDKEITNERPLLVVYMKSPMQCFMRCKINDECWSFDYVMTSGQCRLYDVKAGDLKADDQPGCLVYAVVRG